MNKINEVITSIWNKTISTELNQSFFNQCVKELIKANYFSAFIQNVIIEGDKEFLNSLNRWNTPSEEFKRTILSLLRRIPKENLLDAGSEIEHLFESLKQGKKLKELEKLLVYIGRMRNGLTKDFLLKQVEGNDLDSIIQLKVLLLIVKLDDSFPISFWDDYINLEGKPLWLPVILAANKGNNPIKAISAFSQIQDKKIKLEGEHVKYNLDFEHQTKGALINLIEEDNAVTSFLNFYNGLRDTWVKSFFDQILEHPVFEDFTMTIQNQFNMQAHLSNNALNLYHQIKKDPEKTNAVIEQIIHEKEDWKQILDFIFRNAVLSNNIINKQEIVPFERFITNLTTNIPEVQSYLNERHKVNLDVFSLVLNFTELGKTYKFSMELNDILDTINYFREKKEMHERRLSDL